jgi:hypothetical protein
MTNTFEGISLRAMKEIWSADQAEVIGELHRNCEEAVPLTLIGPAVVPVFITIRSVLEDNGQLLVECEKPEDIELEGELFVFYRRDDLQLMRGFKLDVVRQTSRFFRAVVPDHIFEVQRRKFLRVFVPEGSIITCAPKNSRRILQAQVIDVSMEGAKIFGRLTGLTKGTVLAPLTLTLCFEDKHSGDVVINITEAVVVREIRVREKVELSFHFQSEDTDDLLEKYIDLRVLEQKIYV